ncbi:MAG: hypothetical protein ACI4DY_01525 [Monoglobaceae bacterium]
MKKCIVEAFQKALYVVKEGGARSVTGGLSILYKTIPQSAELTAPFTT